MDGLGERVFQENARLAMLHFAERERRAEKRSLGFVTRRWSERLAEVISSKRQAGSRFRGLLLRLQSTRDRCVELVAGTKGMWDGRRKKG